MISPGIPALIRLALRLAPRDARAAVWFDVDEEARAGGHGAAWCAWHVLRVSLHLRWSSSSGFMLTLARDFSYALYLLRRRPGFSIVAILTLALGIGTTTAIFSVIDAAFLRPVPYPNPDQLVYVTSEKQFPGGVVTNATPAINEMRSWLTQGRVFSQIAAFGVGPDLLTDDGRQAERLSRRHVRLITESYLDMLGVAPIVGRGFTAADMTDGSLPTILLGYGYWQGRYGGDTGVIGRAVKFRTGPATVVGVLPSTFYQQRFGIEEADFNDVSIWMPMRLSASAASERGTATKVQGRLRPGTSLEQAQQQLTDLTSRRAAEPGGLPPARVRVRSFVAEASEYLNLYNVKALCVGVGLILVLACVNVAGLVLAQGAARQGELVIRAALGAARPRLFQQLMTESLVLSLAGGLAGAALASMCLGLIVANIPGLGTPNAQARISVPVLTASVCLTTAVGIVIGWMPAIRLSSVCVGGALAGAGRGAAPLSKRGGQLLIGTEVALAIVLLACGGLMIRSFSQTVFADPGFDTTALLLEIKPVDESPAVAKQYFPALLDRLRALPEVESASAIEYLGGDFLNHTASAQGASPSRIAARKIVSGYFEAIGIPLHDGRLPVAADVEPIPSHVVISDSAARLLFPAGVAIGQHIDVNKVRREIVGVVGDASYAFPYGLPRPTVYLPSSQTYESSLVTVVVRPRKLTASVADRLRTVAQAVGPRVTVDHVRTVRDLTWSGEWAIFKGRQALVFGLFGGVGLLLALVGVLGMTMYSMVRRTREIGVRLALGATPSAAVRMIVRDALVPALVGGAIGLGATAMASRVIAAFLFNTSPVDPATFASVAAMIAVAVCVAAWVPARRASRVDPVAALRAE